jgi:hypothetical protein
VIARALAAALLIAAPAATLAATADAATTTRHCRSADLRYPFQPGLPDDFGVFELRAAGGASCATAHKVAKRWQTRFERDLRAGRVRLPRNVLGFHFATLRPDEAQTYNERGRRGAKTIRFDYRVPNG